MATLTRDGRYGDLGLSGVEVATAHPQTAPALEPLPEPSAGPAEALERTILDALLRPPVVVPFSGGRDSSTILALAARVARREGLELPVPATLRFAGVSATQENEWQELVIRHVGLPDWEVLNLGEELDTVGPVATAAVARHGPLTPPNAHFILPFAELARDGTVLTGIDGDKVFGGWRWNRLGGIARGILPPEPRDVLRAGLFASPRLVQRTVASRRYPRWYPWLAPDVERLVMSEWSRVPAAEPRAFAAWVDWARRRPALVTTCRQLDVLFADTGAAVRHPFLDPAFLAAYAASGGRRGYGGRTAAMLALFGDLLPGPLLARTTKARFDGAFLGRHTRDLIARWDGEGLARDLIQVDALREHWNRPDIYFHSATLLQWVWWRERTRRP